MAVPGLPIHWLLMESARPRVTRTVWLSLMFVAVVCRIGSAQLQVFWGDVHGHTSLSDGKGSLDEYFTYARDDSQLDFVIVTDHDFGNGTPDWNLPEESWRLTQLKADQYTVPGKFVAIAGYEWTSQPKYWTEVEQGTASERILPGPPRYYNHKNVYFSQRVPRIFSAKDPDTRSPNLLAEAVGKQGGMIHNNHPSSGPNEQDQWDYKRDYYSVITNTEMLGDTIRSKGKTFHLNAEQAVCRFLSSGGRTGFVGGSDTHEGKPVARTAVLARELTRDAVFAALRERHNYAVSNARILLRFEIDGHSMGEEFTTLGKPRIHAEIQGTDPIREVVLVRNGRALHSLDSAAKSVTLDYIDESFHEDSYYYLRVAQVDEDQDGNPSRAWSSPIWVSVTK